MKKQESADTQSPLNDLTDLVSDQKKHDQDKKYKVVLAPSFPEEYRAVFEDILKELEKEDKKNA